MLSVPESRSTETKQQCSCHQTHHSAPAEDHSAEVEAFLPAQSEKTYQPAAFTGGSDSLFCRLSHKTFTNS